MIDLLKLFKRPGRTDVFELGEKRLAQLKEEGRYSCYRNTRATLRKLSLFRRGKRLPVKEVTPEMMAAFRDFLFQEMGNSRNTVCENLKIVSQLLAEAGVDKNPCVGLGVTREQSERTYLSDEELSRMMALKLAAGSEMDIARDIFFVECRTGLRISDLLQLRWDDLSEGFIRIRMQKTRRRVEVPVTEGVQHVLDKYRSLFSRAGVLIFPILERQPLVKEDSRDVFELERRLISATARVNLMIKAVAKRAGVHKNISTHVGRHTFATMLINKGASIYEIKELLGHQDIKVTQVYTHLAGHRKQELVQLLE